MRLQRNGSPSQRGREVQGLTLSDLVERLESDRLLCEISDKGSPRLRLCLLERQAEILQDSVTRTLDRACG